MSPKTAQTTHWNCWVPLPWVKERTKVLKRTRRISARVPKALTPL